MSTEKNLVPFFRSGDIGGITYMVTNNIVNYLIVIGTLSGVLGWPADLVFGRVVPGMSIGLLAGGIYYAYMGYRLSKAEGHPNVTALPSGLSTPALFVVVYGIIMPLHYVINDPYLEWGAAVASCFIGGVIEVLGAFFGPWVKKHVPRAAMLGTVSGIAFIWMATQGVFDIYADVALGFPILIVALVGLFGGYLFPKKIPPLVVAIVGGIGLALLMGRAKVDFSGVGFYIPNPILTIKEIFKGMKLIVPYLTILIPVEIYGLIETMDNVEAANAAGDNYSVRETQLSDGICTLIAAIFGAVVPNNVWVGHAGLKKSDAGVGYSLISGIVLGVAGIFGLFTFLSGLVPPAVCAVTFLWCAIVMLAQAFKDNPVKQYAAVGIAMVPPVASYLYTQVTGAVGLSGEWTQVLATGLSGYSTEITQALLDGGVMWNGVSAVSAGSILIGIVLGTITSFIIDKRLDKAALFALAGAVLSFFGFIHCAQLGVYPTSPFFIAYLVGAAILYILHLGRNTWFKAQDEFEYV